MASWDDAMKIFISENMQDFASWVKKGAQAKRKRDTTFPGRKLEADILIEATLNEKEMLLHFEFQTNNDPNMPERLLEYNFRARREYKLPVYSCVIYLRDDGNVPQPPLRWTIPNDEEVLEFRYQCIELAKLAPEDLKQLGLPRLLPLMVLTKGGATRQTTEDVITGLQAAGKQESLPITYTLASLVFKNEADQEWLRKRFRQMQDILRDTPIYQEILKEGREEAREEARREAEEARRKAEEARRKALEEGREEGKLEALRIMLLDFIKARFPTRKMINLAKSQVAMIEDPDVLQSLILKVGLAQTAEEAQEYLISWPETYDGHE